MTAPLREPFFLRGRRSILQRAGIISLALGGLAFVAGTMWLIGSGAALDEVRGLMPGTVYYAIMATSAGIALTSIAIPYSYWLGNTWTGTALRAIWIIGIVTAPCVGGEELQDQLDAGTYWLEEALGLPQAIPLDFVLILSLLWLGWTTAFARMSWSCGASAVTSVLSIPGAIVLMHLLTRLSEAQQKALPMGGIGEAVEVITLLSFGGQFLTLLIVPWGLPFWWPLKPDSPVAEIA